MPMPRSKVGKTAILLVAGLALVGLASVAVSRALSEEGPTGPVREIVLSAKDFRFNDTNPVLQLAPGERVRFVIRNDEAVEGGAEHNFRVVGTDAKCSRSLKPGEYEVVELTVPESGELAYTCCAHPGMGGKIVIQKDGAAKK